MKLHSAVKKVDELRHQSESIYATLIVLSNKSQKENFDFNKEAKAKFGFSASFLESVSHNLTDFADCIEEKLDKVDIDI